MPDHRSHASLLPHSQELPSTARQSRSSSSESEEYQAKRQQHKERETSSFAQRELLEGYYRTITRYPTTADKKIIAEEVGLSERFVTIWFQNKRNPKPLRGKKRGGVASTLPASAQRRLRSAEIDTDSSSITVQDQEMIDVDTLSSSSPRTPSPFTPEAAARDYPTPNPSDGNGGPFEAVIEVHHDTSSDGSKRKTYRRYSLTPSSPRDANAQLVAQFRRTDHSDPLAHKEARFLAGLGLMDLKREPRVFGA